MNAFLPALGELHLKKATEIGNLPVIWPKLIGPFQNVFTNFFNVFGMSFYITSGIKKSDINFFHDVVT